MTESPRRGRPRLDELETLSLPREAYNRLKDYATKEGVSVEEAIPQLLHRLSDAPQEAHIETFLEKLVDFLNINTQQYHLVDNETIIKIIEPLFNLIRGTWRIAPSAEKTHNLLGKCVLYKAFLHTNAREHIYKTCRYITHIVFRCIPRENLELENGSIACTVSDNDNNQVIAWLSTPVKYTFLAEQWLKQRIADKRILETEFEEPALISSQREFWKNFANAERKAGFMKDLDPLVNTIQFLNTFQACLIDWLTRAFGSSCGGYSPYSRHIRVCCVCGKWIYRKTARRKHCSGRCKAQLFRDNQRELEEEDSQG